MLFLLRSCHALNERINRNRSVDRYGAHSGNGPGKWTCLEAHDREQARELEPVASPADSFWYGLRSKRIVNRHVPLHPAGQWLADAGSSRPDDRLWQRVCIPPTKPRSAINDCNKVWWSRCLPGRCCGSRSLCPPPSVQRKMRSKL